MLGVSPASDTNTRGLGEAKLSTYSTCHLTYTGNNVFKICT